MTCSSSDPSLQLDWLLEPPRLSERALLFAVPEIPSDNADSSDNTILGPTGEAAVLAGTVRRPNSFLCALDLVSQLKGNGSEQTQQSARVAHMAHMHRAHTSPLISKYQCFSVG